MAVEVRKVETVYRGFVTLMVATLAGPDGTTFKREIEHHGRAACVLPYDPDARTALLVSLPRAPVIWVGGPQALIEAPAGMVEAGEDPPASVRREALEEAGVRLDVLELVGSPFSSPGFSAERVDLFLAAYSKADRVADGGGVEGEHENITVLEVSLDQLWAWVEAREIEDLKTLALVQALRIRRPELFGA
ncbi:MAG: NUDIX hydrolase [Phenylobacterium sp.]|nr:MAG: NUDIX hydrolase [Phenylobacterium sp.]